MDNVYVILCDGAAMGFVSTTEDAERYCNALREKGYENVTFEFLHELEPEEKFYTYQMTIPINKETTIIDETVQKIVIRKMEKTNKLFNEVVINHWHSEKYFVNDRTTNEKIEHLCSMKSDNITIIWSTAESFDNTKLKGLELRVLAAGLVEKFTGGAIKLEFDKGNENDFHF